jgi:MoaA/NifB/PqqE/SkfB family radical SAM enzyme
MKPPLTDWTPTEMHDWEGKERNVLVLNYTMACALACDFCCYGCHPKREEKMPLGLALRLVDEAAELKQFSSVGFTGGEATLFLDELLTIGDRLAALKLPFTIATAAQWGTSPSEAQRTVDSLADRGLCRFNISHDPSHERFVPREHILNAVRAASTRGIPTYVVGTFFSTAERMQTYLPELIGLPKVELHSKYVAKVGRAAKRPITQATYDLNLELENLCCYRRVYHDIVIWFDGTAYPCCSTFNRATPGIILGNANEHSLRELWQRAEGSLLFRVMKRQGFAELYKIVQLLDAELYAQLPLADQSVGPCSLCNKIFANPALAEGVYKVFARYESEKIDHILNTLADMLGTDETVRLTEQAILT